MAEKAIVIDGSNVAFLECSAQGAPKVSNIVAVRHTLVKQGYAPVVIVDASLRHQVDDPDQLEALIQDQTVRQAPAHTDADYFVLQTAHDLDAHIVSNDQYSDYQNEYPQLRERLIPLMIVKGEVMLYEAT